MSRSHGHAGKKRSPEYETWRSMMARCTNPNRPAFKDYGARGISVCPRWRQFENFLLDMGTRTSKQHSLDRTNNDLGYSPENCRWATRLEQARNTRRAKPVTAFGKTQCISAWATETGIQACVIGARLIAGILPENALKVAPKRVPAVRVKVERVKRVVAPKPTPKPPDLVTINGEGRSMSAWMRVLGLTKKGVIMRSINQAPLHVRRAA